jgi:hypothetical protein
VTEEQKPAISPEVIESPEKPDKGSGKKEKPPQLQLMEIAMKQFAGPAPAMLIDKMDKEHISKMLDITEAENKRGYDYATSGRKFTVLYVLIGVGVFVFLTCYLAGRNMDLYKKLLELAVTFFAGVGGGYGLRAFTSRNK